MGEMGQIMTGEYQNDSLPAFGKFSKNVGETERIISIAGGIALFMAGLKNFSKGGIGLTIAGGALLFRGSTGFCPVNAAINRNTAEKPSVQTDQAVDSSATPVENKLLVESV